MVRGSKVSMYFWKRCVLGDGLFQLSTKDTSNSYSAAIVTDLGFLMHWHVTCVGMCVGWWCFFCPLCASHSIAVVIKPGPHGSSGWDCPAVLPSLGDRWLNSVADPEASPAAALCCPVVWGCVLWHPCPSCLQLPKRMFWRQMAFTVLPWSIS